MSEQAALKDFSPTWEGIKSVGGKALKWAAYGAIALGVLFALPAGVLSIFSGAFAMETLGAALLKGAAVGAIFGAIKGIADMSTAIDDAKQEQLDRYDKNQSRKALAQRMRQQEQGAAPAAGMEAQSPSLFGGKQQEAAMAY